MLLFVRKLLSIILLLLLLLIKFNDISCLVAIDGDNDVNDFGEDNRLLPTIQLVLLVHPFNKANYLPHTLGSIEQQLYPKHRIKLWISTEQLLELSSTDKITEDMIDMNQLTIDMLKKWIHHNRRHYSDIELVLGRRYQPIDEEVLPEVDGYRYWTTSRFKLLVQLKTLAMKTARQNWSQYVLFIDSDVILTNPNVFMTLLTTNTDDMIAVAPMLYSLGTYSNFWAGITDKGYYKRTDDYIPILERQRIGQFVVPMIHSCLFISLVHKKSMNLTFDSRNIINESSVIPFDDIIAFGKSAQLNHIDLYVDNQQVWGYIPPPLDLVNQSFDSLKQDLIDLELESLIEGSEFPISSALISYVTNEENSDTLNVDQIYVINLVRRTERRKRMIKCLKILGIKASIWEAIDGKQLTDEIIQAKGIHLMDGYLDPYHKRPMTFGEIACFLSHYTIWEDMIGKNLSTVIVLEDDVRFERNFKNRLKQLLSQFDSISYDFLYLGRKIQHKTNETVIQNGLFVEPTYSYWTIGYLITRSGAQKLLDTKPLEQLIPVDEFLPIMYDKHTDQSLKLQFPIRNLKALSVNPLLIHPTHYVGDDQYISDTEDSNHINSGLNTNQFINGFHPKHTEL